MASVHVPAGVRTVAEHREVVAALVAPTPAEQVWLAQARGRVLAEDLTAPVSLPPFDNSAMDGYACLLYTSPSPRDRS